MNIQRSRRPGKPALPLFVRRAGLAALALVVAWVGVMSGFFEGAGYFFGTLTSSEGFIRTALAMELPGAFRQDHPGAVGLLASESALLADYTDTLSVTLRYAEEGADMDEGGPVYMLQDFLLGTLPYATGAPPFAEPQVSIYNPVPSKNAMEPGLNLYRPDVPLATQAPGASQTPATPDGAVPITVWPTHEGSYDSAEGVYINNAAGVELDVPALLKKSPPITLKGEGPHVLIIHTHGSEAFHPDGDDIYEPTDVERTEDTRYNVVRVGEELQKTLEDRGIGVIHDRNIYDYPSYSGAYSRSLKAIGEHLKAHPTIKIVIDLHRDSMVAEDGTRYKTVANIPDTESAQVMFVMGTDRGASRTRTGRVTSYSRWPSKSSPTAATRR